MLNTRTRTLIIAATVFLMPTSVWATDGEDYIHTNRPIACKEATARILAATGGRLQAGRLGNPPLSGTDDKILIDKVLTNGEELTIDCGSSPDTISATMEADTQYPPNDWFAAASKVAHGLTGDPLNKLEKAIRKCFLDGAKDPRSSTNRYGYAEIETPKTVLECTSQPPPFVSWVIITPQAK
jgi:hypothetical protein